MSDLSLLWTILSIVGSVFASVAGAAWWLKGQLTSAELAGLREQNAALTAWRGFAVAQAKQLAEQLAEARATQGTLQKQIAEGAQKEVLAFTAASSPRAIGAAEDVLKGWTLKNRPPWERFRFPSEEWQDQERDRRVAPTEPTKEAPKGLLDE
jgi:hypothetical protein